MRAQISRKVFKCMRSGREPLAVLALVLMAGSAAADFASSVVIPEADRKQITATAHFWHEKPAQANVEQASAPSAAARYMPLADETMFDLKPQNRLWIRLDMERRVASQEHIILWIPLPLIDSVTLYQQRPDGGWASERAGDLVAVASWPEPGRYPRFHIELPPGKSSVYLQVQGSTPLSLPLNLGTEVHAQAADREGFLGMGLIVGVLLTLVILCLVTAYTYRDRLYLLYGAYMMVTILAVGAYTGLAAYLLWDHSPKWADAAQGVLALLSAGGALYFIESMLGGRQFARKLSNILLGLAALCMPLAVVYYCVPREVGVIILGAYMIPVTSMGLSLASRAWRRGDKVGQWIFIAYAPLAFSVLLALARAFGWISVSWVVQFGVVVALLIEAPMMMVALNVRSRERHEINTREQAMGTKDALTGLLKEHIFDDRVQQTLTRATKNREDAAIVIISLVNYQSIAAVHGLPAAEQSVLRAVIKLRKVLRDAETVARVGTSYFGLILEGTQQRSRITEIGARLIAQGLMPLPGMVPEVTLQFHLAAVLTQEMPVQLRDHKEELLVLLASMSRRTRRPIRFLETVSTGGTPLPTAQDVTDPDPVEELEAKIQSAPVYPSQSAGVASGDPAYSSADWSTTGQANSSLLKEESTTIMQPRSVS
jgi:two-component system, sensor histidine kinase LadS